MRHPYTNNTHKRSTVRFWVRAVAPTTAALVATSLGIGAPAEAAGNTLYVSKTGCSDVGTGTAATPFCSISAASRAAATGDVVQVAAGTYPEQVDAKTGVNFVAASPSAVVVGVFNPDPSAWSATSSSTAWSTVLAPSVPASVLAGGTALAKATTQAGMTSNSWFFNTSTRTLYVDLGHQPTAADAVQVRWNYGFKVVGKNVIDGFTVQRHLLAGVFLNGSTGSQVKNVTASGSDGYGINDTGGTDDVITGVTATGNRSVGILLRTTTSSTVSSSSANQNQNHGVSVQGGSGAHVFDVSSTANRNPSTRVATGIDVSGGSSNALIERNTTFGNDDSGIEIYSGSNGAVVRRNLTYDNGDHGVDVAGSTGVTVVSNTSVGNAAVGLNVEASGAGVASTGATLRDNISANDGGTRTSGNIRVELGSETSTTIDRNLVFQSGGGTLYTWRSTPYSSRSDLQTATGQEAHGIVADPKFVNLAGRDLHLAAGSPAIDAADTTVTGWTNPDRTGAAPVDDPAVNNTGTGTPPYADLGALERTATAPPPATDAPPTANLQATPASVVAGGTVTLDASASKDDKGITGYSFKCAATDASSTQTTATKTCTYPNAGSYQASVTVTDIKGQSTSATATVTVTSPPPPGPGPGPGPAPDLAPSAALVLTPDHVTEGGRLTLDASGSQDDKGIAKYAFDCGDGTAVVTQTTSTAGCTYAKAGTYQAGVMVTDTNGQSSSAGATATVTAAASTPHAVLAVSRTRVPKGVRVTLNAGGSTAGADATITSYRFRCGLQPTQAAQKSATARCIFRSIGSKQVKATVTNSQGQTSTATRTIRVMAARPHAVLDLSRTHMRRGGTVLLDASRSTGKVTAYRFRCGRATSAWTTSATIRCRLQSAGLRTVQVWVRSSLGLVDTEQRTVRVRR
jgi:PKD repeat protein